MDDSKKLSLSRRIIETNTFGWPEHVQGLESKTLQGLREQGTDMRRLNHMFLPGRLDAFHAVASETDRYFSVIVQFAREIEHRTFLCNIHQESVVMMRACFEKSQTGSSVPSISENLVPKPSKRGESADDHGSRSQHSGQ